MDILEADESPSQATARVRSLCPARVNGKEDGKADDADLVTGARTGFNGGQAPALEDAAAMVPEAAVDSARDLGAETSDNLDSRARTSHGGSEIVERWRRRPNRRRSRRKFRVAAVSTVVPETSASSSRRKGDRRRTVEERGGWWAIEIPDRRTAW